MEHATRLRNTNMIEKHHAPRHFTPDAPWDPHPQLPNKWATKSEPARIGRALILDLDLHPPFVNPIAVTEAVLFRRTSAGVTHPQIGWAPTLDLHSLR